MTLMTLALVLGCVLLSTIALSGALVVSRRARRERDHRLSLVLPDAATGGSAPQSSGQARTPEKWEQTLRGIFAVWISHRWGMQASGLMLLLLATATGALTWFLFHAGLHVSNGVALPLAGLIFFLVPRKFLQMEQSKSEKKFMDFFPAAIDMVVRMLRVGMPVTAAIRSVGQETPAPVSLVFASLADQVEIGIPLEDALSNTGERIGLTDFRFFAVAISLQRTSGGNLVTTLETLSDIIRRRRATRMKAKSATAEVRMSTYVLAAIPFLVIGGMAVLSPAYLTPLIFDPRGNIIVAIAVGMLLFGFWTMRWMMRRAMQV